MDFNLEHFITSILITNPEKLEGISHNPEHFTHAIYRKVNQAISEMTNSGKEIDMLTMLAYFQEHDKTIMNDIIRLYGSITWASDCDIRPLYEQLEVKYRQQKASAEIFDIARKAKDGAPVSELIEKFEYFTESAKSGKTEHDDAHHVSSITIEALKEMRDRAEARRTGRVLESGLKAIDDRVGGFFPDDFIVIGARPSVGKTAILLQIIDNINYSHPCLFFSIEMRRQPVVLRLACYRSGVSLFNVIRGYATDEEMGKVNDACKIIDRSKLYIYDGYPTIEDIRAITKKEYRRHKIELVGIDYFQLIKTHGERGREEEMSAIAKELVNIRKEINIPFIVLSQLNRDSTQKGGKEVSLSQARYTGSIEEAADIGIILSEIDDDKIGCRIDKSRNGPKGLTKINYDRKRQVFSDISLDEEVRSVKERNTNAWEEPWKDQF